MLRHAFVIVLAGVLGVLAAAPAAATSGAFNQPPPCPLDTAAATLTCSFGPLAAGATASRTSWVVFNLPSAPTRVAATATRTASAPADLFPANDSSSVECWYSNHYPGFPPYPYRLFC